MPLRGVVLLALADVGVATRLRGATTCSRAHASRDLYGVIFLEDDRTGTTMILFEQQIAHWLSSALKATASTYAEWQQMGLKLRSSLSPEIYDASCKLT